MIDRNAFTARLHLARGWRTATGLLLAGALCACATPNPATNAALHARPAAGTDYSFGAWIRAQPDKLDERLIVLSLSGGGVRAATLATGVLQELKIRDLGSNVALISSTSGGSLTAAVFAAQGYQGLDDLQTNFLGKNNMAELIPTMLPRLILPGANRAVAFSDFLDERVMGKRKTTYADLMRRWPDAPFVVLNATDMSAGSTFEFTQTNFSYLCSDLASFRLSHAISASASFPFLLNPLPIRNHWDQDHCAEFTPDYNADASLAAAQAQQYLYPERLERARFLHSLRHTYAPSPQAEPDRQIRTIHLLDGGLSDNLAARAVLRELSLHMKELQDKGVRKIMVVQVNAKAFAANAYDNEEGIPSMKDVFWSVTTNPIDVVTELSAYVSRMYLVELVRSFNAQPVEQDKIDIYPVYVDFNLIEKSEERKRAQRIGTSWNLPHGDSDMTTHDVVFLMDLGKTLMAQHPCFKLFVEGASGAAKCDFMQLVASTDVQPMAPGEPPPPPVVAAPAPIPPVAVPAPVPTMDKVSFSADLFFASGKADLQPAGKASLDDLADKLQGINLEVIIVVGHADAVGGASANYALSLRRAEAVKTYLLTKGFSDRVYVEGKGETQPVASNQTAAGRASNRRVEIEVVGTRKIEP